MHASRLFDSNKDATWVNERRLQNHLKRLNEIRSRSVQANYQPAVALRASLSRLKVLSFLEAERIEAIKRENHILMRKLVAIAETRGEKTATRAVEHRSMNIGLRRKEEDRIRSENEFFSKRLIMQEGVVGKKKLTTSFDSSQQIKSQISKVYQTKTKFRPRRKPIHLHSMTESGSEVKLTITGAFDLHTKPNVHHSNQSKKGKFSPFNRSFHGIDFNKSPVGLTLEQYLENKCDITVVAEGKQNRKKQRPIVELPQEHIQRMSSKGGNHPVKTITSMPSSKRSASPELPRHDDPPSPHVSDPQKPSLPPLLLPDNTTEKSSPGLSGSVAEVAADKESSHRELTKPIFDLRVTIARGHEGKIGQNPALEKTGSVEISVDEGEVSKRDSGRSGQRGFTNPAADINPKDDEKMSERSNRPTSKPESRGNKAEDPPFQPATSPKQDTPRASEIPPASQPPPASLHPVPTYMVSATAADPPMSRKVSVTLSNEPASVQATIAPYKAAEDSPHLHRAESGPEEVRKTDESFAISSPPVESDYTPMSRDLQRVNQFPRASMSPKQVDTPAACDVTEIGRGMTEDKAEILPSAPGLNEESTQLAQLLPVEQRSPTAELDGSPLTALQPPAINPSHTQHDDEQDSGVKYAEGVKDETRLELGGVVTREAEQSGDRLREETDRKSSVDRDFQTGKGAEDAQRSDRSLGNEPKSDQLQEPKPHTDIPTDNPVKTDSRPHSDREKAGKPDEIPSEASLHRKEDAKEEGHISDSEVENVDSHIAETLPAATDTQQRDESAAEPRPATPPVNVPAAEAGPIRLEDPSIDSSHRDAGGDIHGKSPKSHASPHPEHTPNPAVPLPPSDPTTPLPPSDPAIPLKSSDPATPPPPSDPTIPVNPPDAIIPQNFSVADTPQSLSDLPLPSGPHEPVSSSPALESSEPQLAATTLPASTTPPVEASSS